MEVPLHEHVVSLDFIRTQLSLEYTVKPNWFVWMRVPYDVKSQTASINYVKDASELETEAILRNRDIHHRTENYIGLSDLRMFSAHRFVGVVGKKSRVDVAIGTSIPVGKTEENQLLAGVKGKNICIYSLVQEHLIPC